MALGVGDVVRTAMNFQLDDGTLYQNIWHHIFDGVGGVSDAAVVADIKAWFDAMYSEIDFYVSTGVTEQLSYVDQVEWVTDEWKVVANVGTFTPAITPGSAGDMSANQIAPFVVFKTARPRSVGRKFMFPTPESSAAGGIIATPFVTAMVAFAATAISDLEIDVLNVLHPGIPRTGVNDWLNFTVAIVTDLVGTQRRRRPGYGA